jgi:subtilisin family serine protease
MKKKNLALLSAMAIIILVSGVTAQQIMAMNTSVRLIVSINSTDDKTAVINQGCKFIKDISPTQIVVTCPKFIISNIKNATEDKQIKVMTSPLYAKTGEVSQSALQQLNTMSSSVPIQDLNAISYMNIQKLWNAGITGKGRVVAILDTGIDYTHPSLKNNILANKSFVSYTNDSMDDYGHGTHVAGIIVSQGNPEICFKDDGYTVVDCSDPSAYYKLPANITRGIAPDAKVMMGKVCDGNGGCWESDIISGMEWAANGVQTTVPADCSAKSISQCPSTPGCSVQTTPRLIGIISCDGYIQRANPGTLKPGETLCPPYDNNKGYTSSINCLVTDNKNNTIFNKNGCMFSQISCPSNVSQCSYQFSYANSMIQTCVGTYYVNTTVKPDVMSLSLGGYPGYLFSNCQINDPLVQEVNYIVQTKGIPVVVAAGNDGDFNGGVAQPACANWAIAAGATGWWNDTGYFSFGTLAGFSGRGYPMSDHGVVAPGTYIFSTVPIGNCPLCDSIGYASVSGTSMATPMVSGFTALLKQQYPYSSGLQIRATVLSSTTQISSGYVFPDTGVKSYEEGKGLITPK